jgi:hypothetical protein
MAGSGNQKSVQLEENLPKVGLIAETEYAPENPKWDRPSLSSFNAHENAKCGKRKGEKKVRRGKKQERQALERNRE